MKIGVLLPKLPKIQPLPNEVIMQNGKEKNNSSAAAERASAGFIANGWYLSSKKKIKMKTLYALNEAEVKSTRNAPRMLIFVIPAWHFNPNWIFLSAGDYSSQWFAVCWIFARSIGVKLFCSTYR